MFDIIVIGGGHAGCEASLASARLSCKTLLVTSNIDQIGAMSCNPAIGGVAKGHLVRELSALGGEMAEVIDETSIQFRTLNLSKGPAVHAFRAQADRRLYRENMRARLESQKNLSIRQAMVVELVIDGGSVAGVLLDTGETIKSKSVILCSGTFLNGKIHIGLKNFPAGRAGDPPSIGLTDSLKKAGFSIGRLKTGTCPRLDRDTIDFTILEEQTGDDDGRNFSIWPVENHLRQVSCHITHTNLETHKVIAENLDRSPLFTGVIDGVGPRYCPSIEDKVKRFPDKQKHQIFLEPEGLDTNEIYPSGLSTSLPVDVQVKFLRTIKGLEKVEIVRPGYAVEYDYSDPTQLFPTLETKPVKNLFFAGQINGTSGYEEAAVQGLVAGINSALAIQGREAIVFPRHNSYIGVLIDDLVTKGTEEPYRMFTSRAEFRLLLRQDNADQRLCEIGHDIGLLPDDKYSIYIQNKKEFDEILEFLKRERVSYKINLLDENGVKVPISDSGATLFELLQRPEVTYHNLSEQIDIAVKISDKTAEQVEIYARYQGYIDRQIKLQKRVADSENKKIPVDFDYSQAKGLSNEVIEKLERIRPTNLGQAGRISGITPSALSILHIYLHRAVRTGEK